MQLYISSYDYYSFQKSRTILSYQKTTIDGRSFLVVEIEEPVIGQEYGLSVDITTLYLLNRFDEHAFDKLNEFPIDVHVFIIKDLNISNPSSLSELQQIVWACLYDNKKDAESHKIA